ncbi:MAG: hypothetical protein J6C93_07720 [Clostridia bacterium]|nr:hypothetical protein [Clostridia bacterium]
MCIKTIRIDDAAETHMRLLARILRDDVTRVSRRVQFGALAKEIGESEEVVRYNVRKLVRLGYLRQVDDGYEPTEKILFIEDGE